MQTGNIFDRMNKNKTPAIHKYFRKSRDGPTYHKRRAAVR